MSVAASCPCCKAPYAPGNGTRSCCGRTVSVVRNGDVGFCAQLVSRKVDARFEVVDGKMKEVRRG